MYIHGTRACMRGGDESFRRNLSDDLRRTLGWPFFGRNWPVEARKPRKDIPPLAIEAVRANYGQNSGMFTVVRTLEGPPCFRKKPVDMGRKIWYRSIRRLGVTAEDLKSYQAKVLTIAVGLQAIVDSRKGYPTDESVWMEILRKVWDYDIPIETIVDRVVSDPKSIDKIVDVLIDLEEERDAYR